MSPPKGTEIMAAIIVAAREMKRESAAICITSGLRVRIRLIAWKNPVTISLICETTLIIMFRALVSPYIRSKNGEKVNSYHQHYFILMIGKRILYMLRCGVNKEPGMI